MTDYEKKTILLVEDDADITMAQTETLKEFGYPVVNAQTGKQAIALVCGDRAIRLVLMDIDLGKGMSGPEAAQQVLEERDIPIVFLTAHDEREMVDKVCGITRYGYVIKTSGDFVLQSSIEMAFQLFAAHQKISASKSLFRGLFENSINAVALHQIVLDADGNPVDYIFLQANEAFEKNTGLPVASILGRRVTEVHPDIGKAAGLLKITAGKTRNRIVIGIADNRIGLQLADLLVKQLHGIILLDRQDGTRYTIEFDAMR